MAGCLSIPDQFNNIYEVKNALNNVGLESASLIIGIDFTKSNEWTGKHSFDGMNLHETNGPKQNPYQHVISVIGSTLLGYDDDKKIPCFGFGDGPTSFAPLIYAAIDIVKKSGNRYHILLIIADGQVTEGTGHSKGILTQQERETIDAIVAASNYPLSIIMVGVGDGPWDKMEEFDDAIPTRKFDNFQFVNYSEIMDEYKDTTSRDTALAVEALMELPQQYEWIKKMHFTRMLKAVDHLLSSYPSVQQAYHNFQPHGHQKPVRSFEPSLGFFLSVETLGHQMVANFGKEGFLL